MIALSFKTRKLQGSINCINKKAGKDKDTLEVYGVTNKDGLIKTGKEPSDDTSKYIIVKENQFVYNPYRVNVGSLGLAPSGFRGIVSPAYVVFETKDDIVPEFLFYYLKSPLGMNIIKWYGDRGGVRSALRFNDLEKIDFPDISKRQQDKALLTIKKVNLKLTAFLEEQVVQKTFIQKLRQAILQEAISGKLVPQDSNDEPASELLKKIRIEKEKLIKEKKIKKERPLPPITKDEIPYKLPKNWEWVKLGDILQIISGYSFKSGDFNKSKGVRCIKITNAGVGEFIKTDNFLPFSFSKEFTEFSARKGDLIIALTRPYILNGLKISKCPSDYEGALVNQRVALLRVYNPINIDYIFSFMQSIMVLDCFKSKLDEKSQQPNLKVNDIKHILCPLAPFSEQTRIVQKINQLMKICYALEHKIKENQKYSELLIEAVLRETFDQ